jgi:hypothetical protein
MVTEVTIPTPPLPPRSAQNRSAWSSAEAVTGPSAGVTMSKERTWSLLKPTELASGPRPPPTR